MGMVLLPKFRWFQSRPKTAWFCRWVLGSAAVLALAVSTFTLFFFVTWWVPGVFVLRMDYGGVFVMLAPPASEINERPGLTATAIRFEDLTLNASLFVRGTMSLPQVARLRLGGGPTTLLSCWLPFWTVLLATWPPTLAAWRNRWVVKREVGRCPTCGYSRTGLAPSAPCPECGTAQAAPIAKT